MRLPWPRAAFAALLAAGLAAVPAGLVAQSRPDRILDVSSTVPFFIADGAGRQGYDPADRELAAWALESWQREVGPRLQFTPAAEDRALIRVYWADPSDGQYGEMRPIVVDGRDGAAVYIRPEITALGSDVARRARQDSLFRDTIVYLTCVHELGHALGLAHTSDYRDIMYFFGYGGDIVEYFDRYRRRLRLRHDMPGVSAQSAGDVRRARLLYPEH